MNGYIIKTSKEQIPFRAAANNALVKAHEDRSRNLHLAMQLLSAIHPTFVSPVTLPRNQLAASSNSANSTSTPAAGPSHLETRRRSNASTLSVRVGSAGHEFGRSGLHASASGSASVFGGGGRLGDIPKPVVIYNPQRMEKEAKVLATIRRKRWLNMRFEFVRASSPTALWFSP